MVRKTVVSVVLNYGANIKPKLASIAIGGAPEDQLRGPLEALVRDLAELSSQVWDTLTDVGSFALENSVIAVLRQLRRMEI